MVAETITKCCTKCGEEKPIEAFAVDRSGRRSSCKKCCADAEKARRLDPKRRSDAAEAQRKRYAEDAAYREAQKESARIRSKSAAAKTRKKERYANDQKFRSDRLEYLRQWRDALRSDPDKWQAELARKRAAWAKDPLISQRHTEWKRGWLERRRENEEFEAFMARMEREEAEYETTNQTTTEGE